MNEESLGFVRLRYKRAAIEIKKPVFVLCMTLWIGAAGAQQRAYFLIKEATREPEHPEHVWWDAELEAASHVGKKRENDSIRRRIQRCILRALRRPEYT